MSSSSSRLSITSDIQSLEEFRPVKSVFEPEDDYDEHDDESRRMSLIRTITSMHQKDYDDKLNTLSREISRQISHKDGEFSLQLDEFNLGKILANFSYFAKKQGIKMRSSGITIRDLNVYGIDESFAVVPTALDILKGPVGAVQGIMAKIRTPNRNLLHNLNGFARPGEMVLVLGRPGAGCTTFLKAISGTDFDLYKGVEGEVLYDGIHQSEMLKSFKNDLIYNPELDCHFPHLTVDQTLTFALSCKTPNLRINGVSRSQFIEAQKIILATVFGLKHTFHTKVGNDFVRGVSGGERKRVSIAEALACSGSLYCWDNATRGLDASTALEFTQAIRTSTKLLRTTAFITIYQAGENIYEKFDKVTVLYHGKQIYFGPRDKAKRYFENMGWECPQRQTTAEFLTAVTDPIGRYPRQGYENKVPQTAEEFEAYWLKSPEYKQLINDIDEYNAETNEDETRKNYYESLKQEKSKGARLNSIYTVSFFEQLKLCTMRTFDRTWGDKAYTITLILAAVAQAFIIGSLYYNTPDDVSGAFSRGGVIFFAVLYMSLMGLAEISASFGARPILMKHKNYTLYHPSADALGNFIISIPLSILINTMFVIILYFLSNLARDAGKFFIAYLFIIMLHLTMGSFFQAIASLNKTISAANAFAGVMVLASLMYSSFMIQRPSMHPWFKWISYINPVLYAFEAIIASEFHGRHMECAGQYLTPSGPGFENLGPGEQVCSFIGSVPGQSWVLGDQYLRIAFTYEFSHVWRNLGILFGFLFFFLAINALGTEYVKPISGGGDKLLYLRGKVPDHLANASDKQQRDLEGGPAVGDLEKVPGQANDSDLDDLKVDDIFVWKDVDYVIPYDGAERKLLDQVSGFCVPGTLTALMGESGAGKTTLLNTLAQRIDFGVVTGDMLVNGKPLDSSFSRRTGYVQQQDIHVTEVTVRESLQFAARLRRPQDVSDEEKLNYVEKIIDVLDMNDYADAVVGRPGNGLNVEQRKKLSIGVELVAKPTLLLFLDEPTSGLDSQSAWAIVKLLRDLANAGQSILCTIHQPSATLFEEFDRLLLLRKGGQTVYFGDIGPRSRTILSYFEKNGARTCDDHENPAEYILEAIGAGATAVTEYDWFKIWTQSPEKREADAKRDQLILAKAESSNHTSSDSKDLQRKYATGYFYQFRYVWHRNAMTFFRDPEYIAAKTFLMTISGLFIGFTFFGLKHTRAGAQNGMFCAFLSVVVSAPVINQIQEKAYAGRELFEVREKLSNTYHWSLLIITQFINELPYLFIGAAIMFVSVYFPTQVDTSPSHSGMFYFTHGIFLQGFAASFGLMLLYIAPDLESAAVLVSFFYSFIVSFSGVVQPVTLMPGFWTFMYKVSPYTYFIQNLVTSFLHGRPIHCSDQELSFFNPPAGETCGQFAGPFVQAHGGYLVDENATNQCGYCSLSNADQYLWTIRAKYSYRWRNVGFFVAYIIFNISACLSLYYLMRYRKIFNNMGNPLNVFKRKKD
ncbi:ATP dependent transporter multidrug resistance [Spathaspora passalidarum NRRL Y-27907]|uniref:ATP dependent transporter multidrug resistance n=1 Tax=Spathaspora passalidarum (strain NRRL Y-27907 / 11-Y1) TaxID=619300 RepID=G3AUN3_SPAPN|nr:ATP dependent transporter multidrug resistance [Spathaspora passalidarum NRRL Y-27907]EGW30589.1 ATP dependent transporter multidrug resistance [Spathaspora passalidarum NRRL Y-27907]